MIPRTPIVRVPVKLRKPIHKDFCSCWSISVFSIGGTPQFILGDNMTTEQLIDFLDSTDECLPIFFKEPTEKCEQKAWIALSRKVPVTIRTNKVLPNSILELMRSVPHSGIQVSMNFLDETMRERLETGSSEVKDLREMLFLAKAWKIFTSLSIEHKPHLVSKLDLLEIVELTKNHVSHILLHFPEIWDEEYLDHKYGWEALKPSSVETFKKYYTPNVPTRSWRVKENHKDDIVKVMLQFIKNRKLTLEVVGNWEGQRIRHINSGHSKLPLGIRPFFYKKENGLFEETKALEGSVCKTCEKPIFA